MFFSDLDSSQKYKGGEITMYIANGNPDIAHTVGNATYIMTEYIKGLFPRGFFKYVHIGTRMAYREFMINDNKIRSSLIKKVRPILVVRPRPIFFDDDIFMARTNLTSPVYSTENNPDRSNYIRCFRDDEHDITLSYMMNRMRVQFSVMMLFDTEIQQQNLYVQLRNRFIPDRPYWSKLAMEILVPKNFMKYISELSGVPIYDPETGSVRHFLNYLMAHSNKYFTYKQNTGTQDDEFFLYYPLTMELVFSDFDFSEPGRKGHTTEPASITFTFTSEFNTIGMYQLSTEKDNKVLSANSVTIMDESNNGTNIIPMFTVQNIFRSEDKDGFKLFFTNIFTVDPDLPKEVPDIIDLSPLLKDQDISEIVKYYDEHGMDYSTLFHFIIMKNNERMNGDKSKGKLDYIFDMKKKRILLYNKSGNASYRLLAYVNNLQIMTIMNSINNLENTAYETEEQQNPKRKVLQDDNS